MPSRQTLASFKCAFLSLAFNLLLAPYLLAAPADELLHVHQMRLAVQQSLGDFYMFSSMDADQRYARMINTSLQQAQAKLDTPSTMPGEDSATLRARLASEWQHYQDTLQGLMETMRKQGFTDLQPVASMADSNRQLMETAQTLYLKIQQESGYVVPTLTQQSRELSLLMQGIAVDYASRSASVGASFFGGGEEHALDEQVRLLATRLDTLTQAKQNTPKIRAELGNIANKFHYIEKSLLNYNQNTVPFLVSKYSNSIIEELENVAAQYAANQL
ncbi:conserved exported hypothetical protein [Pseudomonas sp. 8Z]|uniref:hypothetical protein n=1 Tax=Pseudomonas sp. 8Z TaxID=2653166 RepID=UPI0012F21641|nr:hypothetical protein [Pseudomonas sp. 8Z]VXC53175.1 conserved exported hypothetical protein [Pseudomonas sp. 8Z]